MDLIQAIILGIVQGVTEWLPISSTAHLRVVPALLGWADPGAAFTAVTQLGTLLACLIYFRTDLLNALSGWLKSFKGGDAAKTHDAKMGWAIFIGTLPIVVFGVLFKNQIKGELRSLYVIAGSLIVIGLVMLLAEKLSKPTKSMDDVTPQSGLVIGLWQAIALIPGASRSGSTLSGGLFYGFDRATAARFSFLMSVPSVLAAGIKEFLDERHNLASLNMAMVGLATVISFVVGYATIGFLLRFLAKNSSLVFVVYRIALGLLLLFLLQRGTIQAL